MQSIWMVVAALLFSLMGVAVKLASSQYSTWEIVAYRGLVGLVVMATIIGVRARHGGASVVEALSTRHLKMHLRRGISGTMSLSLWFYAIAGLPLATAMTINYSSPLFIGAWVAWSAWRLGERIDRAMSLALVAGFVGVVLLLQPSFNRGQWIYAIIGVTSTTLTAVAYLSVKALGRVGEPETRIVFYFSGLNAAAGLLGALVFGFHPLDARGSSLLAAVGLTGALAQLAVTRAFGSGGTLLTANLGYTGIVFSSAWGFFIFGDRIPFSNGFGMAIIVVSGVVATLMTARALRRAAVEPDEAVVSSLPLGDPRHASARQS
jgi:S-adenosylmethionine uptake transporter